MLYHEGTEVETSKETDLTTLRQSPEDRSLCSHPQEKLNSQISSGSAFAASLRHRHHST